MIDTKAHRKNRILWADSLKGILIVLVVLGHSIQECLKESCFNNHLWNYIYSFHMAAFMAVSGYLACRIQKNESFGVKCNVENRWYLIVYRRFKQLLIPYFIWSFIKIVVNQHYSWSSFINVFLYPDGYFWFLWVLFFIVLFFQLGEKIAERLKVKQEVVVLGFCLLFITIMVVADIRIFGFQFIAYYYLFYIVGYYLSKYSNLVSTKTWPFCCLVVVWIVMAWYWNMHEIPAFLKVFPLPQTLMQYGYRFLTALIAVYVLIGIGPRLWDNDACWNKPFIKLGQVSLGIYVVHLLLMPMVVKYICIRNTMAMVALSFFIALLVSCLLVWLLGKWKITARLFLGKI